VDVAVTAGIVGGSIGIVFGLVLVAWPRPVIARPRLLAYVLGVYLVILGILAIVNAD